MNSIIKNCFSVDVEGFVESNLQSFHIDSKYISSTRENYEIEKNMDIILSLLDQVDIKGTFFFLGRIAKDIPSIVKEAAEHGHEIACHSYEHKRIFGLSKDEFRDKINYSKKTLEDVSGTKVYGFRAPDFSITEASLWALDILMEIGFTYDSSIYPISMHDVYGIKNTESYMHKHKNGLTEFPLSTIELFGKRLPFCGGGYFRLYPLALTKYLIRKANSNSVPCVLYIHPYEVGTEIPRISKISLYRRFRHYYNCNNGAKRLSNILQCFNFCSAIDILKHHQYIP